ncbi:MAG: 3-isopropylmalate dehydratase large subunit [Filifactoraceae bacterium]
MKMTMTQKILAHAAGLDQVKVGQLISAELSIVLANDITAPVAIKEFEKAGMTKVFDKDKIALVMDHFAPNKDIKAAQQCKISRDFAMAHNIRHFYDVGEMGIEHALLPEKGIVKAGDVVIGADSHTCTYGALGAFSTGVGSTDMAAGMASGKAWFKVPEAIKVIVTGDYTHKYVCGKDVILHLIGELGVDGALYQSLEFQGDGIKNLTMDDRFTIANMAIEAGAKNGIFPVDQLTRAYMDERGLSYREYQADPDAEYVKIITIDLSKLQPTVAFPHLPENTKTPEAFGDIEIHQVVIGSCTNGRLSDMKAAYEILKGEKVKKGVRCIVIPATQEVYLQSLELGYIKTFIEAGAIVSTPTCGPCLGGHMGILAEGERAVATTNRNFVGRMGHVESEVYLASPYVAAYSAITGKLSAPKGE